MKTLNNYLSRESLIFSTLRMPLKASTSDIRLNLQALDSIINAAAQSLFGIKDYF